VMLLVAAVRGFRRVSLVGAGMFALIICSFSLTSQRPVARPDITASVCAALMLVCAARAIDSGRAIAWCGVGFFAGCALTSDLSAAWLVPAAGATWLWSVIAERRAGVGPRHQQVDARIAALVAGTVAAVILYLAISDFRLR